MGSMLLLALLSCGPKDPPASPVNAAVDSQDTSGRIGMRFQAIPEGLLVQDVQDGLGAKDAGIAAGDVVVAVGDTLATDADAAALRQAIIGPPGTAVSMTVQAPLTGEQRVVSVERRSPPAQDGPPPQRANNRPKTPTVVRDFNAAARRGTPDEVTAAAQALVDGGRDGQTIGEAARGGLRLAAKEQPDNARAAMAVFDPVAADDWMYQRARGEALKEMGQSAAAAEALQQAQALRPPDHTSRDGVRADLGGDPKGRRMYIEAAWDAGQRRPAAQEARALMRTGYQSTSLQQLIGMADVSRGEPWSATLPPLESFSAELLDGTPWALDAHEGEAVVLVFWASWCGPCRKEMPELEAVWQARGPEGASFLAVSIDDPRDADEVAKKVDEFGITFPVTHRPDLGERFNVGGIPAVRVLNRRGALHYAAKGYSPTSVERLDEQIAQALAQQDAATPLGNAWSPDRSGARLVQFLPLPGAQAVWSDGTHTVVGIEGAAPMVFGGPLPERVESAVDGDDPRAAGRLAWLDGPVAANEKDRIVRAWDADGQLRWMRTTQAPIVDLAAGGGVVWVATRGGVHAFQGDGSLAASHALQLSDLAAGDGGCWGVGDGRLWWLAEGAEPEDRGAAPDGMHVDADGGVSTGIAQELVVGRFGPDGALRPVIVRTDDTIIATDQRGRPGFTWDLSQPARIAAGDLDGDGDDELLVSISRQGVAVVELNLP